MIAFTLVILFGFNDGLDTRLQQQIDFQIDSAALQIAIGRHLFYDNRLSKSGNKSCSSCHNQRYAFSDGYRTSIGANGDQLKRNALPLFNLDSLKVYTWANINITDLRTQMLIPFFNQHPVEMEFLSAKGALESLLEKDEFYNSSLRKAFPATKKPFTQNEVMKCIIAFLIQIQSYDSHFDSYQAGVENLTEQQETGMQLFYSENIGCSICHSGINFSQAYQSSNAYFNTGVGYFENQHSNVDSGLFHVTGHSGDIGKFRVPSLRNLAFTAPYMHDGSMLTIGEVLDHYQKIGLEKGRLHRAMELKSFTLNDMEKRALVSFLLSLSDSNLVVDKRFGNPFLD